MDLDSALNDNNSNNINGKVRANIGRTKAEFVTLNLLHARVSERNAHCLMHIMIIIPRSDALSSPQDNGPIKVSVKGLESLQEMTTWGKVVNFFRSLAFWKAKVAPEGECLSFSSDLVSIYVCSSFSMTCIAGIYAPKKQLITSPRKAIEMAIPFALWGIIIVAINGAGNAQLKLVNTPMALFNIVSFVQMRYYR